MAKLIWGVLAIFGVVWGYSVVSRSLGPGAEVAFEELLGPSNRVSAVDGFVSKGEGYDVHIRFQADRSWVEAVRYQGFEKTSCDNVAEQIHFSVSRIAAWPLWLPQQLEAVCFRRSGRNKWSPNGRDYLLAEPLGGWVYFAGSGREYDRALAHDSF